VEPVADDAARDEALRAPVALALLACGAAAACGAQGDGDGDGARIGRRSDAIQGGTSDATSTFAVAIVDPDGSVCSGTLIAPNLVLTARHCVASDDGGAVVDCAKDRFLAPRAASTFRVDTRATADFDTAAYEATKVIVPTDTLFCGNDIALLELDAVVPASVASPATPAISPPITDRATYGLTITAIGYGITGPNASDDGTRRRRDGIPIQCIPGDTIFDCVPADHQMTAAELAVGNGLCTGDSGSGAYDTKAMNAGKPVVMGVLSRAGEDATRCIDAVYVRADAHSALIVSAAKDAAAAGGYVAPSWVSPAADAGASDGSSSGGATPTAEPERPAAPAPTPSTPKTTTTTSGCAVASGLVAGTASGSADGAWSALAAAVAVASLVAARRSPRR